MKITPVATGGMPGATIQNERTSPERMQSAVAVAQGENSLRLRPSETPVDAQVLKTQEAIRRIKMKVNQSPDRSFEEIPEMPSEPELETPSAISEESEVVSEETKPLSPQFAALAKQRRALQVKERELSEREKALESNPGSRDDLAAQLKSQPLRVLQEQGILTPEFYNEFTEFLVSGQSSAGSEMQALKDEIKALKEGVDKTLSERDLQAENQVLGEMRKEAEMLSREGDEFELVRETRSVPKVIDLIHRTYKQTGEVLDVSEAMQLVEDELFEESFRVTNYKKIQAKLQTPQQLPGKPPMRTLTNRDTAQVPADRRARAIMAALGQIKG